MRSITVTAEVDVDLNSCVDELLEEVSSKELKEELEKRGYAVMKNSNSTVPMGERIQFSHPGELKRHLCDIADMGYYVDDGDLLDAIKTKLH